jgi:hypothetical protein
MSDDDFLDGLADHTDERPAVSNHILLVPAAALNSAELSLHAAMAREIAALKIPMIFITDGELDNAAEWPSGIKTIREAVLYTIKKRQPVYDKWSPKIRAARALAQKEKRA